MYYCSLQIFPYSFLFHSLNIGNFSIKSRATSYFLYVTLHTYAVYIHTYNKCIQIIHYDLLSQLPMNFGAGFTLCLYLSAASHNNLRHKHASVFTE